MHATCVDLTDVLGPRRARAAAPAAHARPARCSCPIDRATVELVWSDGGYPAHGAYRDYHHHTIHHHRPWANDGRAYDHERGARAGPRARRGLRRAHACADARRAGGGLCVCALDTELLGHWWYEGAEWLRAVLDEARRAGPGAGAARRRARAPRAGAPRRASCRSTTWGTPRDLSTWSGPQVADLAWRARDAELRVLARRRARPAPRAVRELLALQASDWAFMVTRELAGALRARARGRARCRAGRGAAD